MSADSTRSPTLSRRLAIPLIMMAMTGLGLGVRYWQPQPEPQLHVAEASAPEAPAEASVTVPTAKPSPREFAAAVDALTKLRKGMGVAPTPGANGGRVIDQLDRQHKAEPVDSTWSAQAEVDVMSAAIKPAVVKAAPSPQDFTTDCRSRTCRISAQFDSTLAAQTWGLDLMTQMGATLGQSQMLLEHSADGRVEIRIYGSRKQASAPAPSRPRSVELIATNPR